MKLDDQHVLELRCELEELITEREGMIIENTTREIRGESWPYGKEDFESLRKSIQALRERIIRFGEK